MSSRDEQARAFAANLRRLVGDRPVGELAAASGLSDVTWRHLLGGWEVPAMRNLPRIAKAIGCAVGELLPDDFPDRPDGPVGKRGGKRRAKPPEKRQREMF